MELITATNPHTGKRTNLWELIEEDGRKFWFLPTEAKLAESRPVYYQKEEEQA